MVLGSNPAAVTSPSDFALASSKEFLDIQATIECGWLWNVYVTWQEHTDKYRNLSGEDKNKKREYGKNRYHNVSEENKQKLKEYQRKYQEAKNNR